MFDRRGKLESQRVLCLTCVSEKEKNINRLNAQIAQLEEGSATLVLEELNKKKYELQERLRKIQKHIDRANDKSKFSEIIETKNKERSFWEARKIWETLKIENEYSTTMCGCGMVIAYAAKKRESHPELGAYGTKKFISAKQNQLFLRNKREKELLEQRLRENSIDTKILRQSKVARNLGHNNTTIPERNKELSIFKEAEDDARE